jgi:hypothetical protein
LFVTAVIVRAGIDITLALRTLFVGQHLLSFSPGL